MARLPFLPALLPLSDQFVSLLRCQFASLPTQVMGKVASILTISVGVVSAYPEATEGGVEVLQMPPPRVCCSDIPSQI